MSVPYSKQLSAYVLLHCIPSDAFNYLRKKRKWFMVFGLNWLELSVYYASCMQSVGIAVLEWCQCAKVIFLNNNPTVRLASAEPQH